MYNLKSESLIDIPHNFTNSFFLQGILYQVGDIVSLQDIDGSQYYAQTRGFLKDQYARKSTVISWLIPTVPNPKSFDPMYFIPGMHIQVTV